MTSSATDGETVTAETPEPGEPPARTSFAFTCNGPAWKGVPVVNGHVVPASAIDVHIDPEGFPEVTLRFPVSAAVRLGFDPAVIGVDDETREALISLGWTPPPSPSLPAVPDRSGT